MLTNTDLTVKKSAQYTIWFVGQGAGVNQTVITTELEVDSCLLLDQLEFAVVEAFICKQCLCNGVRVFDDNIFEIIQRDRVIRKRRETLME